MPAENTKPLSDYSATRFLRLINLAAKLKSELAVVLASFMLILSSLALVFPKDKKAVVSFNTGESSASSIMVDIEGEVERPGVYKMDINSRVIDLLALAGGLSADADREWVEKNLNKSSYLTDAGKYYIPGNNETSFKDTDRGIQVQGINSININNASQKDLESLPGVGPVTAGRIISLRPYQSIEEVQSRGAVGKSVYSKIKDLISVY